MARTVQILVLFLFAVCAVQCYRNNRHGYSSGRSHSRQYDPRDYTRHRSYGRHGSSHSRLRSSSEANPDTSVSSTTLLKENSPSNDNLHSINVDGKSGDNNQDYVDNINIDGSMPGSGENDLHAGTSNVGGLSPNSNGNDKLPFGNDNGIISGGVQNNPNNSDHPINVNGLNPGDKIDGNPSHDGNTNKIDNLLPYGGENNKPNNDNFVKIDGLTPNDNKHIPNINPGTIDINGKPLDKNGPGLDNGNIKVNGMWRNKNDKLIHDNLPNESKSKPDHSGDLIVHGLPNENNVGGQPGNTQPDKDNGHLNHDKSTIGDKNGPNNNHNTINLHTNDNGLLPGGDSNNSDHGIDNKDKGWLANSGKPIHDNKNVDRSKPTGYKPDENHLNDNAAGRGGGVHKELPNENRPYRPNMPNSGNFNWPGYQEDHNNNWNPSQKRPGYEYPREPNRRPGTHENNFRPHFHDNLDNKDGNNIYPVYLPDDQAIYPTGIISQNSKMPAFYIVMINGQPTLVKNPAVANEKDNNIDINSILGQLGGGGISTGSLKSAGIGMLPQPFVIGSRYPTVTGLNLGVPPGSVLVNGFPSGSVSPLIPGEQQINVEPVIAEPVPVPQPIITEPVSQPIYTIPVPPQNPGGIYGYPSIPYPAPWPAMWDGMNPTINWADIISNLVAHLPHNETNNTVGITEKPKTPGTGINNHKIQDPSVGGNSNQPGGKNVSTGGKSPSNPIIGKYRENVHHQPTNSTSGTGHPGINNLTQELGSNNSTESTIFTPSESTTQSSNNKPTKETTNLVYKPTEKIPTHNSNKHTEQNTQPNLKTPNLNHFEEPWNNNTDLHIPVKSQPSFTNDESKFSSSPYDPTLVNLLNVVLKLPNRGSYRKTKPIQEPSLSENNPPVLPNRQPSTVDKTINDLLAILKSNAGDKALNELIELLKSKSGDKDIEDLLSILKPNASDKTLHELLQILRSHPGGKNIHNLLALLNHYGDRNEPNPAIIRQILRHLLDSYNQPNMNVLVEPGMDEATRLSLILLLNLLANNLGNEYSSDMGFGGLYEQINPANLYFLGHYPCDYANIHGIAGGQSNGLWQLLSHMYGMGNLHNIRLDRSAEEDEYIKPSTPIPNTDDMKK